MGECDVEPVGVPSILRVIRKTVALSSDHFRFELCVYDESRKRELNKRHILECRCDARLKAKKAEGSHA
jgi:hypothetical protein